MSTSCMIFKKKRSWGKTKKSGYLGIYCNWDGHPGHVGQILKRHYNTNEKVDRLIALGDISSLYPHIGQKHDFRDGTNRFVIAYHRDRGDLWSKVKPTFVETERETRDVCSSCQYIYIFKNNKWTHFEK